MSGGTLDLSGTVQLNPNALGGTGGSVYLSGVLINTNAVLDLDTLGTWYLSGGTIRGGTVTGTNDPALIPPIVCPQELGRWMA